MKLVIPSIDILGGSAVRLVQGKAGTERIFGNPLELAAKYEAAGFSILHLVDLDAAFGRKSQFAVLESMRGACPRIKMQWAGGIRSYELASRAISAGADRVVFGTAMFRTRDEVIESVESLGAKRVWGALDFAGNPPSAKIGAWTEETAVGLIDAFDVAEKCNVGGIIMSSVDADGMDKGPDLRLLSDRLDLKKKQVWLAGGMRNAMDANAAFELGAQGVIFGRALYDRNTKLEDLLRLQEE